MRVLSMGAGVQTTACLLLYHKEYDSVIFADTGNEYPETYTYIESYLRPFCFKHDIPWYTVKHPKYHSLAEQCFTEKTVPFIRHRQCTREFKIDPINKKLRQLGATIPKPAIVDIGISLDESHRLNSSKHAKKYETKNYPLLNDKITREQCKKIILDHGWPLPHKSGCTFCGFQSKHEFRKLKQQYPKFYKQCLEMEANAGQTLRMNKKLLDDSSSLDGFCDSGHCFV